MSVSCVGQVAEVQRTPHGEFVWQKIGSDFREILFQKRWLKRNVRHLCRIFLFNLRFWNIFYGITTDFLPLNLTVRRCGPCWTFQFPKRTSAAKGHYISHISLYLFWSQVGFCVTKECHCIRPQHTVATAGRNIQSLFKGMVTLFLSVPQWVVDRPEHNSARILCGL